MRQRERQIERQRERQRDRKRTEIETEIEIDRDNFFSSDFTFNKETSSPNYIHPFFTLLQTETTNSESSAVLDHFHNLIGFQKKTKKVEELMTAKELPSFPIVQMVISIERETLFLEDFFDKIEALNYPKNKLDVRMIIGEENAKQKYVKGIMESWKKQGSYRSLELYDTSLETKVSFLLNFKIKLRLTTIRLG